MIELRKLNDAGIESFRSFLLRRREERSLPPPRGLLTDSKCSDPVDGQASLEQRRFESKYAFGKYINERLSGHVPSQVVRSSVGIWAWLTLLYIDDVIPDGQRALRVEKYISSSKDIRNGLDKQLLFFPWKLVAVHGDDAAWLLTAPLREDTKVLRELANSYRRNVSREFIRLAKLLFYDEKKGKLRRGATTGDGKTPGTLRHLDRVTNQLDITYDVFGMETIEFAAILPKAFKKWLS